MQGTNTEVRDMSTQEQGTNTLVPDRQDARSQCPDLGSAIEEAQVGPLRRNMRVTRKAFVYAGHSGRLQRGTEARH